MSRSRLVFFNKNIIRFNLIQRFKFSNLYKEIPFLSKITIVMHSHHWSSDLSFFVRAFFFFRLFFHNKPSFYFISLNKKNPTKTYELAAFFRSDLRRHLMFYFFELFILFLPRLKKKYIKIFDIFDFFGNHRVNILDLTVFFKLGEDFFQWPYPLSIFFILKNCNKNMAVFLLKRQGFPLFN